MLIAAIILLFGAFGSACGQGVEYFLGEFNIFFLSIRDKNEDWFYVLVAYTRTCVINNVRPCVFV